MFQTLITRQPLFAAPVINPGVPGGTIINTTIASFTAIVTKMATDIQVVQILIILAEERR